MQLDKEKMRPYLQLVLKILEHRKIENPSTLKDEFDQILNCIIQGRDVVNAYERREIGITDEVWDNAVEGFFKGFGKSESK